MLDSPRVGRRLALSGCMLLAGVVLVLSPLIPPDQVFYDDDNDNENDDDDNDNDDMIMNDHEELPCLSFTKLLL